MTRDDSYKIYRIIQDGTRRRFKFEGECSSIGEARRIVQRLTDTKQGTGVFVQYPVGSPDVRSNGPKHHLRRYPNYSEQLNRRPAGAGGAS